MLGLIQAQTTAAQEQEAARAAKARKEQLALRQSKQLIPVMSSSKAKHPGSNAAPDRPHLTSLRKPSGSDSCSIPSNYEHSFANIMSFLKALLCHAEEFLCDWLSPEDSRHDLQAILQKKEHEVRKELHLANPSSSKLGKNDSQAQVVKLLAGMEALGKVSAPAHAARKEEEGFPSNKGVPLLGPSKPAPSVTTSGTSSPKALPGKPARERDRLTFFSSLKRKVSGGEQPAFEGNGDLHRQVDH